MKKDTKCSLGILLLSIVGGAIITIIIVVSFLLFVLSESHGAERPINKNYDGSVITNAGPLKEEGKRIIIVDLIQMTPVEIYFSDGHPKCDYSEFYYLAVINMETERFIKTILVRAPNTYLINEVKVNGIEATYTEYPPMDIKDSKAYAIPTLKSQAGMNMDIEVTFFSGEKDIKKVVLHTKSEHWSLLEQRVAKYLFE